MPYYVYELIDPRTDTPAYIGITYDLDARLQQHIHDSHSGTRKSSWIRELLDMNLTPGIKVIEVVDAKETAQEREKYWVQHYISSGIFLTNTMLISLDSHPKEFHVQVIPITKNFYTAGEVKRKLGIDGHRLLRMINSGKIKKLVIPGTVRGIYSKIQIDKLADEIKHRKARK